MDHDTLLDGLVEAVEEHAKGVRGKRAPVIKNMDGERLYLVVRTFSVAAAPYAGVLDGGAMAAMGIGSALTTETMLDKKTFEVGMLVTSIKPDETDASRLIQTRIAVSTRPWTPEEANEVLAHGMPPGSDPRDAGSPAGGLAPPLDLTDESFHRFALEVTKRSDSFIVLGHCKARHNAGRKQSDLEKVRDAYGYLLNLQTIIDRRGRMLKDIGKSVSGGYVGSIPCHAFHKRFDLPLEDGTSILPMRESLEDGAVLAWARKFACARIDPDWPLTPDQHSVINEALPYLREFSAKPEENGVTESVLSLGKELAQERALFAELAKAGSEVTADLSRSRDEVARLEKKLHQAQGEVAQAGNNLLDLREKFSQERARWGNTRKGLEEKLREAVAQAGASEPRPGDLMFTRGEYEALQREFLRMQAERDEALGELYWEKVKSAQRAAQEAPVELQAPGTWEELLESVHKQLPRIWMDRSAVAPAFGTLDQTHESKLWLARAWTALVALNEYAGERNEKWSNFRRYITDRAHPGLSQAHVTLQESHTVRTYEKLQQARVFKSPLGDLFFESHIDIGGSKPPSPRLHFYDAVTENGMVLVGYIGPHLPNTQTN